MVCASCLARARGMTSFLNITSFSCPELYYSSSSFILESTEQNFPLSFLLVLIIHVQRIPFLLDLFMNFIISIIFSLEFNSELFKFRRTVPHRHLSFFFIDANSVQDWDKTRRRRRKKNGKPVQALATS